MIPFTLDKQDAETGARAGTFTTDHGIVETPVFMPVGTHGTVKAVTPDELEQSRMNLNKTMPRLYSEIPIISTCVPDSKSFRMPAVCIVLWDGNILC